MIKLLGLNGGGGLDDTGLVDGSVDSEKVARERDVVRGRHCARLFVGGGLVGEWLLKRLRVLVVVE